MIDLDYKSGVPIYDQMVNGIIRLITIGALKVDSPLPSVRSMANMLGVNPNTVQRAYSLLESKGIIYSISGKGSFVSGDLRAQQAINGVVLGEFETAVKKAAMLGIKKEQALELIDKHFKEGEGH